ncbi:MAG: hypothetical protein ACI86M_003172 [Saprospiraceae bacterium]|jgi:hypothetical protein
MGGKKYEVSLIVQYINDNKEVAWTMTVSGTGFPQDFVRYEGKVYTDNSLGTLKINTVSADSKPYLDLSFDKNVDSNDISIWFSNILEDHKGLGYYIKWRTTNGNEYDRAYDVTIENNLLEIQANHANANGKVKDPKCFNDSEWHWWN